MTRQQIFLILGGLIAVILIYQLPRVVVENETGSEVASAEEPHDFSITDEDQNVFTSLLQQVKGDIELKKSVNFADSLAKLYLKYQQVDSATAYAEYILRADTSTSGILKAALIYYRSFQMSQAPEKATELAIKAKKAFEVLLVDDPQNNFIKNKLAMTLMTTENPMAGVQLLREVLADDENNREAILNLGLLAIKSGQYDRAKGRFEKLLSLDSTDFESLFYYGVTLSESGEIDKAQEVFQKIVNQAGVDPALKATASSYIEEF